MARRCCCPRGCIICADDFNRGDSTNLGGKWDEILGDSETDTNELLIPVGAKVRCTVPHPIASTPTCILLVKVTNLVDGAIYGVRVNTDIEGAGGDLVEFEISGATSLIRAGGDEFDLGEAPDPEGEPPTLAICRSRNGIWAGMSFIGGVAWGCVTESNGGRYVVLENNGGVETRWDDFSYEEHFITNPDCLPSPCDCEGYCLPKELTLTLWGVDLCGCFWGWTRTLTAVPGGPLVHGYYVWEWTGEMPYWDCIESNEVTWRLLCEHGDCISGWKLKIIGLGSPCGETGDPEAGWWKDEEEDFYSCPMSVQCNPMLLVYGAPFMCDLTGETCLYTIEITE